MSTPIPTGRESHGSSAGPQQNRWPRQGTGLYCGGVGQAWPVHGAARPGPRVRGGRRVPRGQRGQAGGVLGTYHDHRREQRTTATSSHVRSSGCGGVLTVLVPRGVDHYSSGTAQAVLDHADPAARLVFSCGYHITRDGQDVYSWKVKLLVGVAGRLARLARMADLDDQVEACRRVFASGTRWTVVRGSDLEEGPPQGLPVWSRHVGDPILKSNLTRRVDFARFMVEALQNDELVHEAPAIVGCQTPSALAHAAHDSPALR